MKFTSSLSALLLLLPALSQVSALTVREPESELRVARQFGGGGRGGGRGGQGGGRGGNRGGQGAGNANGGAAAGGAAAGGAAAGNNGNNNAGNGAAAGNNNAGNGAAAGNNNAGNGAAAGNNNAGNGTAAGNNNAGNGAAAGNNNNNNNGGGADAQTSLTLDPAVIAKGFANNGQDVPTAGQVASLTSTNNFINFCLTVPNLPLTDGKQITTGSCNPAPIGVIPSTDNMPSSKFQVPANGDTIAANTAFTVTMAIQNIQTGNFVNAQENYFAAPQQLNGQGQIIGHSHVVIETLSSLTQTTPTNPKNFAFFKGINGAAQNGVVTADVTNGLPAGAYRICSINSSSNHQPVIVPVAQHGSLDDCSYFTVSAGGAAAGGNNGNNNANNGAAAGNAAGGAAAASATAAGTGAAATSAAAGNGGNNGGNGGGRGGRGGKNGRRFLREY